MENILEMTKRNPVIPVVKLEDPQKAPALAQALLEGGIRCAEITFRTSRAAEAIERAAVKCPQMLVGAGTVINAAQAEQAVKAGAAFIVSPGFSREVILKCQDLGVPCLPGCVTPSEIMEAYSMGLSVVKFFPAEVNGGVKTLKALAAPFGDIRFVPTGGVTLENLGDYLELPFVAACGGSWMVKESDIAEERFDLIRQKSAEASALAGRYRHE